MFWINSCCHTEIKQWPNLGYVIGAQDASPELFISTSSIALWIAFILCILNVSLFISRRDPAFVFRWLNSPLSVDLARGKDTWSRWWSTQHQDRKSIKHAVFWWAFCRSENPGRSTFWKNEIVFSMTGNISLPFAIKMFTYVDLTVLQFYIGKKIFWLETIEQEHYYIFSIFMCRV